MWEIDGVAGAVARHRRTADGSGGRQVRVGGQRDVGRARDARGEHDQPHPGIEGRAVRGVFACEALLPVEDRENVPGGLRRGSICIGQLAPEAGEGKRLIAGIAVQHPAHGHHQQRVHPLEQDVDCEPLAARRRADVDRVLAPDQPLQLASHDALELLGREPEVQSAARHQRSHEEGSEVRDVASVEDLTGWNEREHRGEVARAPCRRVDEDVRAGRQLLPDPAQVGESAVGEDDPGLGVLLREHQGMQGERRDAPPRVDQDREPALVCEGEDLVHRGLGEVEPLSAGMQLDPARARVDAATRLDHRGLPGIEPAERHQAPTGGFGFGQHPIVRGRITVGLVHRHHDPPRAGGGEGGDHVLGRRLEPVGIVEARVRVDVEERVARQAACGVVKPRPDEVVFVHSRGYRLQRAPSSTRKRRSPVIPPSRKAAR